MNISNPQFFFLEYGPESSVFRFATEECEDYSTQNYTFACCFVWV
jgi:hypothetical protein